MQKLLTLGPTEIQTSVYPGTIEAATPLWKEGRNVVFRELGIKKVKGGLPVLDSFVMPLTVRAMLQGFSAGNRRLYVADQQSIKMIERTPTGVTTSSDIGSFTTATAYANLESWGNWLIANNGVDRVKVWKNGGLLVDLANTPFTYAKIVKRKSPYLLAFNTSNGEAMVEWSHTSDIENWTVSASTEAGNMNIRDLESGIVAVTDMGDRLAAYSNASLVLGTYLGRPNVFGWRRVLGGIGAVSAKSVVAQGPYNFGLTFNGIFKTDGNSYVWIDDPAAQRWVVDNVDWGRADEIIGFHDDYFRVITWFFFDKGAQAKSISYHYDSNQFVTGDLHVTAAAQRDSWDVPILAGPDRVPVLWQQGADFNGEPPAFYLRTKPLDFGSRDYAKILNLIRVDGIWGLNTTMRVGALSDPEGVPEWFYDGSLVRENYFEDEREAGFFVLEFSGDTDFHITGIEFYGVPGGIIL